ncbi:MAG: protein kinase [Chlamydiales bacterium]|nr:protein kinase [Chlamydiales bacterium]
MSAVVCNFLEPLSSLACVRGSFTKDPNEESPIASHLTLSCFQSVENKISVRFITSEEASDTLELYEGVSYNPQMREVPLRVVTEESGELHIVLAKIKDIAKCFNIEQSDAYKACIEGNLMQFKEQDVQMRSVGSKKAKTFESIVKAAPNSYPFFPDEIKAISACIETNFEELHVAASKEDGKPGYQRASESLPRAVEVSKEGDVLVHFNKLRLGDRLLGEGTYKTVRTAISCDLGKVVSIAVAKADNPDLRESIGREYVILKELEGTRGIASALSLNFICGKENQEKAFLKQPCYEMGSLNNPEAYSEVDRLKITLDLLYGLKKCKANGIIHRDIKPGNVLIGISNEDAITGEREYSAHLSDFGSYCRKDEIDRLKEVLVGTPAFFSPEYIEEVSRCRRRNLEMPLREFSDDMWALGCTLYKLCFNYSPPWFPQTRVTSWKQVRTMVKNMLQLIPPDVPVEECPLVYMICDLLAVFKDKRLTDPGVIIAKYERLFLERIEFLEKNRSHREYCHIS